MLENNADFSFSRLVWIGKKYGSNLAEKVVVIGFLFFVFIASYYLIFHIAENVQSDIKQHTLFIPLVMSGAKKIPHFLWHALVWISSQLMGASYLTGAVWVTSGSITILAAIKYVAFSNGLKNAYIRYPFILLLSILSMIAMPIYIPFFNHNLYLGQGGVGIWHSPTLLLVKPFSFVLVLSILWFFKKKEIKIMIFSLVIAIGSILAKPNFIMILIPALFSYALLMNRNAKLDKKSLYFIFSMFLLSVIVLSMQFYVTYLDGSMHNSLAIRFGAVWQKYTPSVCISILTALAFPLLVWVGSKKNSGLLLFCWLLAFFGIFEAYFFVEINPDRSLAYDFNFCWGYLCATDLLFTFSMIHYFTYYSDYKKIATLGNVLLILHGISGLVYLQHIVFENNYL